MDVGGGVAEGQTHFPEQRQEGFQGWPILLNKHDRKININSSKKSPGHKINITSSSSWSKIQYFFYMGKCKSYYFPSSISTIWIWSKAAPCNNKYSSLDFDKMWSSFPPPPQANMDLEVVGAKTNICLRTHFPILCWQQSTLLAGFQFSILALSAFKLSRPSRNTTFSLSWPWMPTFDESPLVWP